MFLLVAFAVNPIIGFLMSRCDSHYKNFKVHLYFFRTSETGIEPSGTVNSELPASLVHFKFCAGTFKSNMGAENQQQLKSAIRQFLSLTNITQRLL
ncbi:MAG: hypothetical protein ACJA11_001033 [Glaciecola sp.]|jgi:hypothetical protein